MKILPNDVAVIEGDTHHAVWIKDHGLVHDQFTASYIKAAMKRFDVKVAVDAGANIGTLTRPMLNTGAEVHAFECNPEALECVRYNCPKAKIYPVGLSDKQQAFCFVKEANAGASYLSKPEDTEERLFVHTVPLDMYDLDPQFIKLDIEGFEVKAIKGAERTIRRARPMIFAEVNCGALLRAGHSEQELWEALARLDYRVTIVQPGLQIGSPQYDVFAMPL